MLHIEVLTFMCILYHKMIINNIVFNLEIENIAAKFTH